MYNLWILVVFFIGYLGIIFEHQIKLNKAAIAIFMAVACWGIFFISQPGELSHDLTLLNEHVSNVAQVVFFLLGAMTIVELMDSHGAFTLMTRFVQTTSKKKMLWAVGITTFFLSAVLDNLTTTILMISLLRKLLPESKERLLFACLVVIASNAGGAWTPIGDVTTTMLWIKGQLSTWSVMKALFIPSFIALIVPLVYLSRKVKGKIPRPILKENHHQEPGAFFVLVLGFIGLIFVPILKAWTGLPPFMGILISLAILWLITDGLHAPYQNRKHLTVPHIFTKIDLSGILFFLGILLCVGALEAVRILDYLAQGLNYYCKNLILISTFIGVLSAIVDNVPLVAATIGMYPLEQFPMDHSLWHMIAYAAGVGGSLFIIGSASGVALMGLEKIDFISYMKTMTIPAFLGYGVGLMVYLYL